MSLLQNSNAIPTAGDTDFYEHQIANSARFTGSGVLSRTAGTATNEDKFTISCWVKRSKLGATQNFIFGDQSNIHYQRLSFNSSDKLEMHEQRGGGDSNGVRTIDQVFRDTSAWMHIVWTYDTAQSTDTNREKFYVNGTQLTNVEGWDGNYPSQNRDSVFNKNGSTLRIGAASSYYGNYFQGYMAEVVFCDGQAYAASDFGETKNGVWIPKDPSGLTFGNNGFYLNFANASDMGNDVSGNNNDFSESNVETHDQMTDTPTFNSSSNGGNFATLNPLAKGSNATLSEGNLRASGNSSDGSYVPSTMAFKTGKWYCEFLCIAKLEGWPYVSIFDYANQAYSTSTGTTYAIRYQADDDLEVNTGDPISNFGTITLTSTGLTTYTAGDIIGIHLDCDNKKVWFSKNGSFFNSGDPSAGTNPQASWTGTPTIAFMGATYQNYDYIMNFGQDGTFAGEKTAQGNSDDTGYGNFYYAPDTGFLAMCAGNYPIPDSINPSETDDNYPQKLFNAVAYTGNGSSGRTLSIGMAKKPSISMNKRRSGDTVAINTWTAAFNSGDYDSFGELHSDADWYANQGVNGPFSADPTASTLTYTAYGQVNASSAPYVSWNWVANGGSTSSNSNGSLTSTVEVDPSGCFSVGKYTANATNSTIGHGLSKVPSFILIKKMTGQDRKWTAWHTSLSNTQGYFSFNTNSAAGTDSLWNNTAPTSSVFSVNYGTTEVNAASGHTYLFWAFANCEGWIKAGKYIGNANADGTFVYTGFKPAWIFLRAVNSGDDPQIYDNARDTYNPATKVIPTHSTAAETDHSNRSMDILSNGFKFRDSNSNINGSDSDGYLYLAMAHNPFKYATAR